MVSVSGDSRVGLGFCNIAKILTTPRDLTQIISLAELRNSGHNSEAKECEVYAMIYAIAYVLVWVVIELLDLEVRAQRPPERRPPPGSTGQPRYPRIGGNSGS